jgi:hypothetical protein
MAETQPPLFEQECYDATDLRVMLQALSRGQEGVVEGMATTAGTGLSVSVAPGSAFVMGDTVGQGTYLVVNGSATVVTLTAPDPSQTRNDLIVAEVLDMAYGGASNTWRLRAVPGAPGGGMPVTPPNSVAISYVVVRPAAGAIGGGDIGDLRTDQFIPRWQ